MVLDPPVCHRQFQMRGGSVTALVLRLDEPWQDEHTAILAQTIGRAPDFYRSAPLVFDLCGLASLPPEQIANFSFDALAAAARANGLIPVAVQNGNAVLNDRAAAAGLALTLTLRPAALPESAPKAPAAQPPATLKTMVVRQPVRSGQTIEAPGDLVVLSSVSPGAELIASGHIHIYGALRGRALAGIPGDETALIYAQHFDAELVAIAGVYQVSDNFALSLRGGRICIALRDQELTYETLP